MSVYRIGKKCYVYVTFPDGTRYRKSVGTKRQAEEIEKRIKSAIVQGKWEIYKMKDVSFSDLAAEYLEYARMNKAPSSFKSDRCRIELHLLPYFDDIPIKRISAQMVEEYKQARLKEDASPNTVNHELTNLSHMLRLAIQWQYIDRNVVSNVQRMRLPERPTRFLSKSEILRLMEAARESYIYPILMTALHTGMRKSELLNLKWTDIDFDQCTVTVQAKEDWHTKNYKSRTLQLTPALYEVLRKHRKQHLSRGVQSEYMFTYRGKRIRCDIKGSLKTVLRKAHLVGVTLHTLRHTFASQLAMAGVSLKEIQELMGHLSFETTLQYAHLSEDHVKRQVMKLPFAEGLDDARHNRATISIDADALQK
ncbi:tyrosine-type recombinase/integrase [Candidatus Poribacteria bacterium]